MLILFDIDMTLLETDHIGIDCLRHAGQSLFDPGFTIEGITFGGALDPVIISEMLVLNNIEVTAANIQAMRRGYHGHLRDLASSQSVARALPGAHDLVFATASHHSKPAMGLLTGNYEETGTIKIKAAGFDPSLFTINAWGDSSPHASPVRAHLPPVAITNYRKEKSVDLDPQSVVIIGDTVHDVTCAKDNGCRVLAVATGHASFEELVGAGAEHTVDDLTDTAGILAWIMSY
jgi:phosphoglycolate phosphatase-like HAD superfamily hydrolase